MNIRWIPKELLRILPKRSSGTTLDSSTLAAVSKRLESVSACIKKDVGIDNIILDYPEWFALIQRLQLHNLTLDQPFRILLEALENDEFKLNGLTSREFATLVSITSKSTCPYAAALLDKLCDTQTLVPMISEMRNSDLAATLSSLAKSGAILHADENFIRREIGHRIPRMHMFDVIVSLDALGRFMHRDHLLMNLALERVSELVSDQIQDFRGDGGRISVHVVKSQLNYIAMLTRALARSDVITCDNIKMAIPLISFINTMAPMGSQASLEQLTTILMHITCMYCRVSANGEKLTRALNETIIGLIDHLHQFSDTSDVVWTAKCITKIHFVYFGGDNYQGGFPLSMQWKLGI
ncbi:hypothetical protein BdWA1_000810 [Babesia duncani]|uniref:Uncharacterized protein n=1 Tax=Babesia duncani TaxID=323732 RepID=A0AAD9PNS8_9APIC|nr:hypothetical protein BdWA1_000810 [Babesia duncani]